MSAPARILMLVLNLNVGGQERMLIELSRALDPKRFAPLICCLEERGALAKVAEDSGIEVLALNKPAGISLSTARRLRAVVRDRQIALIHSHNNPGLFYGALTSICSRTRHVHTKHGVGLVSGRTRFLNRLAGHTVHTFVPVSDALSEQARLQEGIPEPKIVRIDNGIDLTPYLSIERPRSIADGPVIGHVARLSPVKNQRLLINLFADFQREQTDARLVIVGDGPNRAELENLAAAKGIRDHVCFAGVQSDVAAQLKHFDWFALTSLSEGTPLSVIEAMAAGLPITSTRVGGMGAIVSEGETGFLADPDDRMKMLEDWRRLAQDRRARLAMGQAARQFARAHYDISVMVRAYEAVYTSALN